MKKWEWRQLDTHILEKSFGKIAVLKNGNIAFKCGSPNQCSQCARCGNPKDARPN